MGADTTRKESTMPNYLCVQRSPEGSEGECAQSAPKSGDASPAKMEEMYAAFTAWREKFKDNIVDMGGKLGGGAHVTEGGVSDGPFVEAKEVVGGFMILSADTLEQAVEIARGIPGVISAHSSLEVREIQTP